METRRTEFVHGAYYPSWKIYRNQPPSSMNLSILTHVFYAFVRYAALHQPIHRRA